MLWLVGKEDGRDILLFTGVFGPFRIDLGCFVCIGEDTTKVRFSAFQLFEALLDFFEDALGDRVGENDFAGRHSRHDEWCLYPRLLSDRQ